MRAKLVFRIVLRGENASFVVCLQERSLYVCLILCFPHRFEVVALLSLKVSVELKVKVRHVGPHVKPVEKHVKVQLHILLTHLKNAHSQGSRVKSYYRLAALRQVVAVHTNVLTSRLDSYLPRSHFMVCM